MLKSLFVIFKCFCRENIRVDFFIWVDPTTCPREKEFGRMIIKGNMGINKSEGEPGNSNEFLLKLKEMTTTNRIIIKRNQFGQGSLLDWLL